MNIDITPVGTLTISDARAKDARIQINLRDGRGWLDVTRGYPPDKPAAERDIVVAASDVEGWIGVLGVGTRLIAQVRGYVRITFEACSEIKAAATALATNPRRVH